jgi:hypothetical protein
MLQGLRCLGFFVLTLGLLIPSRSAEPAKPDPKKPAEKPPVPAGQITGKLVKRFPTRKEMEELKKDLDSAKGDLESLPGAFERFKEGQARAYGLVVPGRFWPVDLEFAPTLEVRLKDPPTQYDKKGNIVKPTPEILRKLRGTDPKKPGYLGDKSDLKEGQIVVVHYLSNSNADVTKKSGKTPPAKEKEKPPAKPDHEENKLVVGMIFVAEDPNLKKDGK